MSEFDLTGVALRRDQTTHDIKAWPHLPELPDGFESVYDAIESAERELAAPNLLQTEYIAGTATKDDEIEIIEGGDSITDYIFTAEHATAPASRARGGDTYPDAGTAGLTSYLAKEHGKGLVMVGRQTMNVPTAPEHPIKDKIAEFLPESIGFVAVHGMAPGKLLEATDDVEIQAILGLGKTPDDLSREAAEILVRQAADFGLRVIIGNDHEYFVQKPGSTELKTNDDVKHDGSMDLYRGRLAALGEHTTVNFVNRFSVSLGRMLPAVQVELTNLLRVTPLDSEATKRKDRVSQVRAVALAALWLSNGIKSVKVALCTR